MAVSDKDLEALGIPLVDDFVPVPPEWKLVGRKTVQGKKSTYSVLQFARPNEGVIELWSHSIEIRPNPQQKGQPWIYAKKDHIERQAEEARKR